MMIDRQAVMMIMMGFEEDFAMVVVVVEGEEIVLPWGCLDEGEDLAEELDSHEDGLVVVGGEHGVEFVEVGVL